MTEPRKPLEFYLKQMYAVRLHLDEEGGVVVDIPDLPGCTSQGESVEEAMEMIDDAQKLWIETAYDYGNDIPLPSEPFSDNRLTETEIKVAAKLLDVAGDVFSNRGCNDFNLEFIRLEDRHELIRSCEEWNGTPEDFDPNQEYKIYADFCLMNYLSQKFDSSIYSKPNSGLPSLASATNDIEITVDRLTRWAGGSEMLSLNDLKYLIKQLSLQFKRISLKNKID